MAKQSLFSRFKGAYNLITGRYTAQSDGFPVFSHQTNTGMVVNHETALYSTAVFACVNLIASAISQLPLVLYNIEADKDRIRDTNNPLYKLLLYRPNAWQTPYEYWLFNMECLLLRGGFLSWKNVSSSGQLLGLVPLHPDSVTRKLVNGKILISGTGYITADTYMQFTDEPQESFFWANYRTTDGINPCSPIKYASESIGLSLTAEAHGARVFKNDATPPLVIKTPNALDANGLKNMAKMWKAGSAGGNYGMPRFIDQGADIVRLSMSNEDAQYIQTRKYQKEDICSIYHVPARMLSISEQSKGWATLEQQNQEFLTYTLAPYLKNIEDAINRSLIPEMKWGKSVADFDVKQLLRADVKAMTEFHRTMYNIGSMSPNEIRQANGLNKREGGDEFVRPANMAIDSEDKTNEQI